MSVVTPRYTFPSNSIESKFILALFSLRDREKIMGFLWIHSSSKGVPHYVCPVLLSAKIWFPQESTLCKYEVLSLLPLNCMFVG